MKSRGATPLRSQLLRHNTAAAAAIDANAHLALTVPWIAELFAVLTSHLRFLSDGKITPNQE